MTWTVLALARRAAETLQERGLADARLEAERLLASVLGLARLDLYLQHDRPVTEPELERFRDGIRRRLRREPLQYILGEAGFRHLVLRVDRRVLIPRPETEILVGRVLDWARARGARSAVDVGTGSGAIALSLAGESALSRILATDCSADALAVARQNADRLGLRDRIEFRTGDALQALPAGERFDMVVSNPPYVAESEREALAPEVRDWEPPAALFAGANGLAALFDLVDGAPDCLTPGGLLAVEVGIDQAGPVVERVRAQGGYVRVEVGKDLAGKDRIVLAERV